jgi:hypothetical protein
MEQLVQLPSRNEKFLDLILTTQADNYHSVSMFPPVLSSDHYTILASWRNTCPHAKPTLPRRNFIRADYQAMTSALLGVHWHVIFNDCESVNDYWNALYCVLTKIIDDYVPVSYHSGRRPADTLHVAPEVRAAIIRKRKAWRRWRKDPNEVTKAAYNMATRDCNQTSRCHLAATEDALLDMNKHSFYSYVSRRLHPTCHNITLLSDGRLLSAAHDIARCLSTEFSRNFLVTGNSIGQVQPNDGSSNGEQEEVHAECPILDYINVDIEAMRKILHEQRNSAAGPDGIPGIFYKQLACVLARPLTTIFQQSIHQCAIPDMWRKALVIPLYKGKGSKTSASSYRPISLIDVACKILERLITE